MIDARGVIINRKKLKLSLTGFESFNHKTQESFPIGTYTINLYLVRGTEKEIRRSEAFPNVVIGSTMVKVQEFQLDRMKLSVRLSAEQTEGWVSPQGLKVLINLQNLFGTPASDRRITAKLSLLPVFPAFPSYRSYKFYDPQRTKKGFDEDLPEMKTDSQGNAEIDLRLDRFVSATYRLHLVVQGFEPDGGRSISAEKTQIVSSLTYLIGVKTRDSIRSVHIIAIDSQAKKIDVDNLKQVLIERRYLLVLTRPPNGTYKYESKPIGVSAPGGGDDSEIVRHPNPFKRRRDKPVDYRTMERKALVGSEDFFNPKIEGQVNATQAKRSSGSTLKPFVYALALDQGALHQCLGRSAKSILSHKFKNLVYSGQITYQNLRCAPCSFGRKT